MFEFNAIIAWKNILPDFFCGGGGESTSPPAPVSYAYVLNALHCDPSCLFVCWLVGGWLAGSLVSSLTSGHGYREFVTDTATSTAVYRSV